MLKVVWKLPLIASGFQTFLDFVHPDFRHPLYSKIVMTHLLELSFPLAQFLNFQRCRWKPRWWEGQRRRSGTCCRWERTERSRCRLSRWQTSEPCLVDEGGEPSQKPWQKVYNTNVNLQSTPDIRTCSDFGQVIFVPLFDLFDKPNVQFQSYLEFH